MLLATNGLQMRVETYGDRGDPLVLLHGALSDHLQNWRMVLQPLAARYRVIALDLRGHGATDNPTGSFTLCDLRDDVLGVLDALEVPRAHLLGCSLGGYVALALRELAPQRVGALALAGVKVGWSAEDAATRVEFFTPENIGAAYPLWLPYLAKSHALHYGPEHWKTLVKWVAELLSKLATAPGVSLEALRAETDVRALFYALGDRDGLVPLDEIIKIRKARPDAEIQVLPHAGHLFREYNQEVFLGAFFDFLKRNRLATLLPPP